MINLFNPYQNTLYNQNLTQPYANMGLLSTGNNNPFAFNSLLNLQNKIPNNSLLDQELLKSSSYQNAGKFTQGMNPQTVKMLQQIPAPTNTFNNSYLAGLNSPFTFLGSILAGDQTKPIGQRFTEASNQMLQRQLAQKQLAQTSFTNYLQNLKLQKELQKNPLSNIGTYERNGQKIVGGFNPDGSFQEVKGINPEGTQKKQEVKDAFAKYESLGLTQKNDVKVLERLQAFLVSTGNTAGADFFKEKANNIRENDKFSKEIQVFDSETKQTKTVFINNNGELLDPLKNNERYTVPPNMKQLNLGDRIELVDMNKYQDRQVFMLNPTRADQLAETKLTFDIIKTEEGKVKLDANAKKILGGVNASFIKLTEYEKKVKEFNGFNPETGEYNNIIRSKNLLTPTKRVEIEAAHKDLLLQLKEAYNLGVLNGPDLTIMEEVISSPTSARGMYGGIGGIPKQINVIRNGLGAIKKGVLEQKDIQSVYKNNPRIQALKEKMRRLEEQRTGTSK